MTRYTPHPDSRSHGGFTLVEMLVVIAILLVLTALTITITGAAFRASEVRTTGNVLTLLETALNEWQSTTGHPMSYGVDGLPTSSGLQPPRYDVKQDHIETTGSAPYFHFDDTILDFVGIVERTEAAKAILANIDPELLQSFDDPDSNDPDDKRLGVRDAWDNLIRVVFPGRIPVKSLRADDPLNDPSALLDDDGTARNLLENTHGIATNRRVYFTSAGPDGKWGNLHLDVASADLTDPQRQDILDAADNLYSYEVLRTRPTP